MYKVELRLHLTPDQRHDIAEAEARMIGYSEYVAGDKGYDGDVYRTGFTIRISYRVRYSLAVKISIARD